MGYYLPHCLSACRSGVWFGFLFIYMVFSFRYDPEFSRKATGSRTVVSSFTNFVLEKLLILMVVLRIIDSSVALTPLQGIAHAVFVLRGQRLIPSGTGKVGKPPPCVLSFYASCQLAASATSHGLSIPAYSEAMIEFGLLGARCADVLPLLGRGLTEGKNGLLLRVLGGRGCFCLC